MCEFRAYMMEKEEEGEEGERLSCVGMKGLVAKQRMGKIGPQYGIVIATKSETSHSGCAVGCCFREKKKRAL